MLLYPHASKVLVNIHWTGSALTAELHSTQFVGHRQDVISVALVFNTSLLADRRGWGHLKLGCFQFPSLQLRIHKKLVGAGVGQINEMLVRLHRLNMKTLTEFVSTFSKLFLILSIPYVSWIYRHFYWLFRLVLYVETKKSVTVNQTSLVPLQMSYCCSDLWWLSGCWMLSKYLRWSRTCTVRESDNFFFLIH